MKKPVITIPRTGSLGKSRKPRFPKMGYVDPDLLSLEDPGDFNSPFDPDPALSRGLQEDVDDEASAALVSILDERRQNRDKYRLTNDQDYYLVVCFQSEEQKREFLDKSGWPAHEERLVDGLKVAEQAGLGIEPIELPMKEYTKPMPVNLREREVIR